MLSFEESNNKKNKPLTIALVNGPDFDKNKHVYLYQNISEKTEHVKDSYDLSDYLADKYDNKMSTKINGDVVDLGKFENMPKMLSVYGLNKFQYSAERPKGQTHFISLMGAPGSGKSTWMGEYIKSFNMIHKNKCKIFYFSAKSLDDDDALNQFENVKQIDMLDGELINQPMDIEDIKEMGLPVLAIFDDILPLPKKSLNATIHTLNSFVKVGRSYDVTVLYSLHSMSNGIHSKISYDNSTAIVYFLASNKVKVEDNLKLRFGFKPNECRYLTKLKSRWLMIKTTSPEVILTEKNIIMLDDFRDNFIDDVSNKKHRKKTK